jgi:predicted Zn-dependent peptidase
MGAAVGLKMFILGRVFKRRTINKVVLKDAVTNYKTNFVPGNAYLVVVGDVNTKEVKKWLRNFWFLGQGIARRSLS